MYLLDCEYWSGDYDRSFWKSEKLQKLKPLNTIRKLALFAFTVFAVMGIVYRVSISAGAEAWP